MRRFQFYLFFALCIGVLIGPDGRLLASPSSPTTGWVALDDALAGRPAKMHFSTQKVALVFTPQGGAKEWYGAAVDFRRRAFVRGVAIDRMWDQKVVKLVGVAPPIEFNPVFKKELPSLSDVLKANSVDALDRLFGHRTIRHDCYKGGGFDFYDGGGYDIYDYFTVQPDGTLFVFLAEFGTDGAHKGELRVWTASCNLPNLFPPPVVVPAARAATNEVLASSAFGPAEAVFNCFLHQGPNWQTNCAFWLSFGASRSPLPLDFASRFTGRSMHIINDVNSVIFYSNGAMVDRSSGLNVVLLSLRSIEVQQNRAEATIDEIDTTGGALDTVTNLNIFQFEEKDGHWSFSRGSVHSSALRL